MLRNYWLQFLVRCFCVSVETVDQQLITQVNNSTVIPAKMSPMILPKPIDPASPMVGSILMFSAIYIVIH
jgi:hypothetical protein